VFVCLPVFVLASQGKDGRIALWLKRLAPDREIRSPNLVEHLL